MGQSTEVPLRPREPVSPPGRRSPRVIAERLRALIAEQKATECRPAVTVTIGVAVWDSGHADELVSRADDAVYAGKAGRDNVQLAAADTHPGRA